MEALIALVACAAACMISFHLGARTQARFTPRSVGLFMAALHRNGVAKEAMEKAWIEAWIAEHGRGNRAQ